MSLLEIRELERRAFRAWPALETRANFGWVQRFAGGYTKRANSINAIDHEAHFTPDVMAELLPLLARGLEPGAPLVHTATSPRGELASGRKNSSLWSFNLPRLTR